jgi:DNA-binding MarR family transcriptional regulator
MSSTPRVDFYTLEQHKQSNGLSYDLDVDNAIIDVFRRFGNKAISSGRLKLLLNRENMSSSTYSEHLKRLLKGGILKKHDYGRGKEILYHLTKLAQKQIQLHLLGNPVKEIFLFRRIIGKILFYDIAYTMPFTVEKEVEFYKILSRLNINKNDVNCGRLSTAENDDSVQILYEKNKSRCEWLTENYWKEREGQSTVLEEVEFICYPLIADRDRKFELECKRIEYWEINKYSDHKKYRAEYLFKVFGFTVTDILNNSSFKKGDVERTIETLIELGLIRESFEFNGKRRYIIVDETFHHLLEEFWGLHESEFSLLLYKWHLFEAPTKEERDRMIRLLGEHDARRLLRQVDSARSQHNLTLRECESLEKYNEYLKRDCFGNLKAMAYDAELELYKQKARIRKDILCFVQYRKERLYLHLKNLPVNLEEEGIEDIKMYFGNITDQYAFLYPVIKDICPRAFESPDYELQERIIIDEMEKEKAEIKLYNKLGAIYRHRGRWHNVKSKNGKRIPYKMMRIRNPQTGKVERTKVLEF